MITIHRIAKYSAVVVFGLTGFAIALPSSAQSPTACGFEATLRFTESAPRDRFVFKNTSSADWRITGVTLDLSPSSGKLMFDVTASGAGVEVFQAFRTDSESAILSDEPVVKDGDQVIDLAFSRFGPNEEYGFSIDVDDQLSNSELGQIRVSDNEISGAVLSMTIVDSNNDTQTLSAAFTDSNEVVIASDDC